jgi:toxin ParE1/3/4
MSASRRRARARPAAPRRLLWTRRAEADLDAIGDYIAADNPVVAERWVGKLIERIRAALDAPLAGRVVPEVGMEDVREVFLRTCRLVYRVRLDAVVVLTIFEGHRRFPHDVDVADDPDEP